MRIIVRGIALVLIAGGILYVFRAPARTLMAQMRSRVAPCTAPIPYTVASIDPRFGVSTSTVLNAVKEAVAVWESPSHRRLFVYASREAVLTIRLAYDDRQRTTQKLSSLGLAVEDTRAAYDSMKAVYDSRYADYLAKKAAFESAAAAYESDRAAYERDVSYWNERGGAPQGEYDRLQQEQAALQQKRASVEHLQSAVNAAVADVNALASSLNKTASALNLDVARYNTIGSSVGDEFEEGVYESAPGVEEITIYEFASREQLMRVLAHELGHALGLEHVDDPSAIMYRVNQSANGRATRADLAELDRACTPGT